MNCLEGRLTVTLRASLVNEASEGELFGPAGSLVNEALVRELFGSRLSNPINHGTGFVGERTGRIQSKVLIKFRQCLICSRDS